MSGGDHVLTKPGDQPTECEASLFMQTVNEVEGRFCECCDADAVHQKKRERRREGYALVPVDERVVLRKAFPKRRRLLDQVAIVARLRPKKRRLKQSRIADARRAAVAGDQVIMDSEDFDDGQIDRHFASF